ncbi:MAG TPA: MFS transporter [Devosiaceae bacterium]|jgi:MFS family permease
MSSGQGPKVSERSTALAPFEHSTFRNLWLANLSSNFGGLIQGVGAAWLMTSITDSVDMVALVQASTSLPVMLFSVVGGAIADSFNRRNIMLGAQYFMVAVSALLAVCTFLGVVSPWLLLTFTFLIGCGTALNNPSFQASVGDVVPRTKVPAAVALNSIGFNLSRSIGPAIGGVVVAVAGAAAAFGINAISYLALIGVLLRWHPEATPSLIPRESIGGAMQSGIRYVAMSPDILKVLLRSFIFSFSGIVILALLPVISAELLGGGPLTYGLMLGAFGIGAVGGALVSAPLRRRLNSEAIVRCAFIGFCICALLSAMSTSPWLTAFAMLFGGASWVLANALFNVSVQLASPRWVVGRALSLYQTASFGGMALGAWFWGLLADGYDLKVSLVVAGLALLAGGALGLLLALPQQVPPNLDPLGTWREPHLELDLQPNSGPIMVEIAYIIAAADIVPFLDAMTDRKRIRRRDGARDWTLRRDLNNPELWVESYKTPTWLEYIRHNLRRTQADSANTERLRELHRGSEAPIVHRFIERPTYWLKMLTRHRSTIDPV